jgi:hypothetical protein
MKASALNVAEQTTQATAMTATTTIRVDSRQHRSGPDFIKLFSFVAEDEAKKFITGNHF